MPTSLLVVTPSPAFGEQVRQMLEDTGAYAVHIVSSKAAAIVRADEESCRMAFLDLDLGESWVEEVGQSLRTVIPNIRLFLLAGNETPPPFDSLRPWALIRKPLQLTDLLKMIAPDGAADGAVSRDPLWLTDVNKAAQHLTRLTLESSSQAALITREGQLWAYAGQLSQAAAQEVARVLARTTDTGKGDLLRFARLESTRAEHMLYATQLPDGMLLAMVFDAETPFSTIRSQASQLATSLSEEGETPEDPVAASEQQPTAVAPAPGEVDDEDEFLEMPPISEILRDIPVPDPPRTTASRVQAPPPAQEPLTTTVVSKPAPPQPAPAPAPLDITAQAPQPVADPAQTRPSIFSQDAIMPVRLGGALADATIPHSAAGMPSMSPRASSADDTVASEPRPETPVRTPAPRDLDETRPSSAATEIASSDLTLGSIVLEPITAGVYHLSYACLLLPRLTKHFLTGDMADRLSEWVPIICVAFGWRLEHLAVRPEYLQWVVNVAPATSPGYVMRVIRQQLSDKIFAAFPRLKRENPSGDFWAPGYLIMGGSQPHPPQLVKDYIKQIRQRQGIEKLPVKTPRS